MNTPSPRDSPTPSSTPRINWRRFYLLVGLAMLVTVVASALLMNIFERKTKFLWTILTRDVNGERVRLGLRLGRRANDSSFVMDET